MALRDVSPIRIPVRKARRTTARTTAAVVVGGPPVLAVPFVRQTQNQWCWAACSQMVAAYLGNPNVKQCELANFLHEQTNCCVKPSSSKCNQPSPVEGINQVYRHLNIDNVSEELPTAYAVVIRELQAGRPIEVGYQWFGGGGHVAIIYGATANGMLLVHDPWYGSGVEHYFRLRAAYGMGRWTFSFGLFKKAGA
jgi:hypothetical protein